MLTCRFTFSSRQISKALQLDCLQKLRREGRSILANLEERSQWLPSSSDVRRYTKLAADSYTSVDRVAQRLEQLAQERKDRLKELARLRTLQDEAEEVRSYKYLYSVGYIWRIRT